MLATEWITKNIRESDKLDEKTLISISDFVLMWAIFEATKGADISILERIPDLARFISSKAPDDIIAEHMNYWSNRYITNGSPNERFRHLRFRNEEQSYIVFSALNNTSTSVMHKIQAALLIIYRYRNNLFHGLKDITNLNNQYDNLNTAIDALQKLLPYSGRYVFLGAKTI